MIGLYVPHYRWSKAVKELWDFSCAYCGSDIDIESHHIEPQAINQERINNLTNGIALCHKCHLLAHGGKYYSAALRNKYGRNPKREAQDVMDFVDSTCIIVIPKGQKSTIEAAADAAGESVNMYTQKALLARMGLTDWPELPEE